MTHAPKQERENDKLRAAIGLKCDLRKGTEEVRLGARDRAILSAISCHFAKRSHGLRRDSA